MKTKSTKKALFTSVLSLLLCCSMLIGTTFAWFTDSVESGINKIQAGNLDIELYYGKEATPATNKVTNTTDDLFTDETGADVLWEPGVVAYTNLNVVNEGSLVLKYQFAINFTNENYIVGTNAKLSQVLKVAFIEGGVTGTREEILNEAKKTGVLLTDLVKTGNLEADKNQVYGVVIYWEPSDLDNNWNVYNGRTTSDGQPLHIDLGLKLIATQKDAEDDSFGTDYDEDAWHPDMLVTTAGELATAIENIKDGGIIALSNSISFDSTTHTDNGGYYEGLNYVGDKSFTIDLNGYTITNVAGSITDRLLRFENNGTKPNTITIKNGTLEAIGAYSAVATAGSNAQKMTINLENVKANMGDTNGSGATVLVRGGAELNVKAGTVIAATNAYCAIECAGGATANIYDGAEIYQNGTSSYCGSLVGASGNGTVNVYGGYGKGTKGAFIVMTSGGTINVHGGKWIANTDGTYANSNASVLIAQSQSGAKCTINVTGGTFKGGYNCYGDAVGDAQINISAGIFNADPSAYVEADFKAADNANGTFIVVPRQENGNDLNLVSNYPGLFTDGTNYYVYDAVGLISMRNFWKANSYANNMWGRSYNIMADIDATGYTWDEVWMVVGDNNNNGFVFDGNGHTITGLTINGALFGGTPNGGNKPNNPGYVQDITFDGVKVIGDHFTGVLWSNVYNELVVENVSVINSEITGKCNVAALVGGTVIETSPDASVTFINCVVKNNVITAEGKEGQDPNGANAFLSRAYGNTAVIFEGTNVAEDNTITNGNSLVGGGIYGYTVWANGGFTGTGTCNEFTKWNGISVAAEGTTIGEALSSGASEVVMPEGNYGMPGTSGNVTISGTKDTVITVSGTPSGADVTFNGVTVKGSGYATGVNAATVTYNNATIIGEMCLYREKVVFNNCTFELNGQYIWTYGAAEVEFNNCTFNTTGKAILIYNEGDGASKVTVKGCTFNATSGAKAGAIANQNCAAIEIDNYQGAGKGVSHELITEGNTYSENFSGEWRIKNYQGNSPITVNGTEYTQIAIDGKLMTIDASKNVTVIE